MIVVSETSPLTARLQIGRLDLLETLFQEILIPEAVRDELSQSHHPLPSCLHCEPVKNSAEVERLRSEIDLGEAEAIVLAKELNADLLLIDEAAGRRVAQREGLRFIGLLGVLVEAKQHGLIHSVRNLTADLERTADFRVSEEIKSAAFQKAGE